MLRKLLKYDFLSLKRYLIPLYSLTPVLALLAGMISWLSNRVDQSLVVLGLNTIFLFSVVLLILSVALLPVLLVVSYYKGLYSDTGYLTLLLPVKRRLLILSKLICALLSILVYIVVAFFSIGFVSCAGTAALMQHNPFYAYTIFFRAVGDFLTSTPLNPVLLAIEGLIYLLVWLILEFSNYYFGVTLGAVVFQGKGKIWGGILFCIAVDTAVSIVLSLIEFAISGGIIGVGSVSAFESALTLQIFLIVGIVLRLAAAVGVYFLNVRMTEKKLNLA